MMKLKPVNDQLKVGPRDELTTSISKKVADKIWNDKWRFVWFRMEDTVRLHITEVRSHVVFQSINDKVRQVSKFEYRRLGHENNSLSQTLPDFDSPEFIAFLEALDERLFR